jgi:hypothetical protein
VANGGQALVTHAAGDAQPGVIGRSQARPSEQSLGVSGSANGGELTSVEVERVQVAVTFLKQFVPTGGLGACDKRTGLCCGNHRPPRGSRSWLRQTIGSQSLSPWRSQPCHAFTEPGGYTRSQEDTKKIQVEYRRNRADTTGHERTRHCAGSGP